MTAARRLGLPIAAAIVALLHATVARADNKDPTPEEVAAARELAKEGVKLAREGNCEAAVPKLERARDLYEAPVIPAVALGDCLIQAGKIVRGTEILQLAARANLGAKPEKVNVAAKEQAQLLLDQALPKIAKLVVQVDAPAGVEVVVTVDKQPLPRSLIGIGRPSDPGERLVEASAPGFLPASKTITLTAGQEASVSLTLAPDPVVRTRAPQASGNKVPAIVLLGVGGAGIAIGTLTGALALSARSTLNGECPNQKCPPSASGDVTTLTSLSWASTIAFAVGAASAGVGVVLLVRSLSADAPRAPNAASLRLMPTVGPGTVGLVGEF